MSKRLGRDTVKRADTNWPKGYPILYEIIKNQRKKEEEIRFVVMAFAFPGSCCRCWGTAYQEVAEHLPNNGKQWANSSFWLTWVHGFCFSNYTVLIIINETSLSFLFFSPCPGRGETVKGGFFCYLGKATTMLKIELLQNLSIIIIFVPVLELRCQILTSLHLDLISLS